ncbi:MAG: 3'-5' exonuclease, partial [Pseudomonadota bacterium]
MQFQGFILNSEWEDKNQTHIITLWAIAEVGPVCLILTKERPLFFVEKSADLSCVSVSYERKSLEFTNFNYHPVDALYFNTNSDLRRAAEELSNHKIATFEADVRSPDRFLMERFIYGEIEIEGEGEIKNGVWEFINPQIKKGIFRPQYKIHSLDIETGRKGEIYSIAFVQRHMDQEIRKILMVGKDDPTLSNQIIFCATEKEMLRRWLELFQEANPDLVIGWNVIGFDLLLLLRKCQEHHLPFTLGRKKRLAEVYERRTQGWVAKIPGRVVID